MGGALRFSALGRRHVSILIIINSTSLEVIAIESAYKHYNYRYFYMCV